MKKKKKRRLKASERPPRIPSAKVVMDKKNKGKKRSVLAMKTRKEIKDL